MMMAWGRRLGQGVGLSSEMSGEEGLDHLWGRGPGGQQGSI